MAVNRVKMLDERTNHEEIEFGAMDQISKLPDPIIHHILSFLPTIEVVRMSLLSKRWRRMWFSVQTLNLCEMRFQSGGKAQFNKFVDRCLKRRKISRHYLDDSSITRFKLDMSYCGRRSRVERWLNFVAKNKLEELHLCITTVTRYKGQFYNLPEAIFNVQSLTRLKLDGLKIDGPVQVRLPSLKLLFLENIHGLNDRSFEDLLINCPSLEKLVLKECKDLSSLQVSSSSLKSFDVDLPLSHQTIKIEAINLRSLLIRYCCKISLTACVSLKHLSLFYVQLDDRWFKEYICGYSLDSLTLHECYAWEHINLKSQHLKNLVICKRLRIEVHDIKIDTPNLVSFTYTTWGVENSNISLISPNLLVCDVNIVGCHTYNSNWYGNLMRLLSAISCSKNICLHVDSDKHFSFALAYLRACEGQDIPSTIEEFRPKKHLPLAFTFS
ncbi:hypothetical protein TIFTF001_004038 [Ficus carica]|uniref:F-box domain-containing protein n=1 Tax=Ficus carica TaxID=3494 RepID=A0AA87ZBI4_FICCA|nr:hypothetical protein TIFTF001_004038 [Ficus carica]